jgi:cation diffusion facilitator CzcD-associated flavoprotein CzcO
MPKPERNFGKWERTLFAKIPGYQWLMRKLLYWQFELRAIGLLKPFIMQWGQKKALAYLQSQITDPDLQTKLTPNYTMGCKRILLSNDFYAAVSREHVDLVTSPINQVSAKGLITEDGQEHEVDAIICATGFQVAEAAAPFPIYGPNQWQLADAWQAGAEAYLGTAVHGFPNFFIIVGPNSGLGHNSIVFIIESQVQYILDAIRKVRAKGIKSVEVKADVQQNYNRELAERFKDTVWTTGNCQSWYHTASGKNTTLWPGFSFELRWRTRRFNLAEYRQLDQSKPGTIPATSKRLEPTRQIS